MKSNFRNHGKVEYLCIRPARLEPVKTCQSVQADIDQGLVGDHFCGKAGDDRMVTLIQAEHIELIGRMLDQEIDPALLRRNIVISGVNLLALKGKRFQIGEAIFEGTKPCPPCSRQAE